MPAIRNGGFLWPRKRVTVNLAPADRRKRYTGRCLLHTIDIMLYIS